MSNITTTTASSTSTTRTTLRQRRTRTTDSQQRTTSADSKRAQSCADAILDGVQKQDIDAVFQNICLLSEIEATRIQSPEAVMHTLLYALEHDASLNYFIKRLIAAETARMGHGVHMDRVNRKLPIDVQDKRTLATRITKIKDLHPDRKRMSASAIIHPMDILAAVVDGIGTTQSTLSSLAEAGSMLNKLWRLVSLSDLSGGVDIVKAVYDAIISRKLKQWYAVVLFFFTECFSLACTILWYIYARARVSVLVILLCHSDLGL
jgi:hypothetical protein